MGLFLIYRVLLHRFAFNFVPGLRRASARLSLEGDIHFIKRACARHRDVQRKKRGVGGNGKREKIGGKFKRARDLFFETPGPIFYHLTVKFASP